MVKIPEILAFVSFFDEVEESPHFEKRSFRVKKKIFLTIDEKKNTSTVKLTPEEQSAFMAFDKSVIYPATGTWGKSGWTIIDLNKINVDTFSDALRCSYCNIAPKKLAEKYKADW